MCPAISKFLLIGLLVSSGYGCSTHKREKVAVHTLVGTQWRLIDPDSPSTQLSITATTFLVDSPEREAHPYHTLSADQLLLDHDTVELAFDQEHRLHIQHKTKAMLEAEALIYVYPFEQIERP